MSKNSLLTNSPSPCVPAAAAQPSEPTELEIAQAEAQEYLNGWQRAKADYANLKRENEIKVAELTKFASEELLKELLPMVDYFKHALKVVPPEQRGQPWVEGIRHIQLKLMEVLAYYGIKELEVVGEKFNPEWHEAVGELTGTGNPAGTVVEEVRTGFLLHDKLVQPARVKVAH